MNHQRPTALSQVRTMLEECSQDERAYFIQAHWRRLGNPTVSVWCEWIKKGGRAVYEIQSNLLNGRPRRGDEGEGRHNPNGSRRVLPDTTGRYDERRPAKKDSAATDDRVGDDARINWDVSTGYRQDVRRQAPYDSYERHQEGENPPVAIPQDSSGHDSDPGNPSGADTAS